MSLIADFFFFSSRRRHTRFDCDWSSDVCSSDLVAKIRGVRPMWALALRRVATQRDQVADALAPVAARDRPDLAARGAHAGEMRGARGRRVAPDARHELLGAVPPGAGRARG